MAQRINEMVVAHCQPAGTFGKWIKKPAKTLKKMKVNGKSDKAISADGVAAANSCAKQYPITLTRKSVKEK